MRRLSSWVHLYQRVLLFGSAMLAAISASCLQTLVCLVHLSLLASWKTTVWAVTVPPSCCCLGCCCSALTDRSGRLRYRQAQSSHLRVRCLRRGMHLAVRWPERGHRGRRRLQTGRKPLPVACDVLERTLKRSHIFPTHWHLMLLLLFDCWSFVTTSSSPSSATSLTGFGESHLLISCTGPLLSD